jgi:fibronectin type 3 domain-containing protein
MRVLSKKCLFLVLFAQLCGCRGAGNKTAPSSPVRQQHHVDLQWNASTSTNVTYNAYRSVTQGGPYSPLATAIAGLTYSDSTVKTGTTYYYVVTAVDDQGRESTYSGEAAATVR